MTNKSRSVMMYGISGSTKTSQVYHMVKWILSLAENKGKYFRMIHSDGGGYQPFIDSGMVERRQVRVFDFSYREHALADYRKLSQGYWPIKAKDKTGEIREYFKKDSNCLTKTEEWEKIAGYIVEGMASTAEVLKTHISNQREGVGFKESWSYEEDGESITGLQMGHYGLIQKEIYASHMKGFNTLPVPWLIYTSLLGKGEDKQSRETVYGPQVAGNATTPQVPSWFMDCLHLDKAKYQDKNGNEVEGAVAWFTRHEDVNTQIPYLCKARVLPELYPKLIKEYPYGFIPLGYNRGVDIYFETLDRILKEYQINEHG